MDPIRPIGPAERDVEPIVRVTRSSPPDRDGRRRDQPDQTPRRKAPNPSQAMPPPEEAGGLIDIKV